MQWGDRYTAGEAGPPVELIHEPCGQRAHPRLVCDHCGEPIDPRDVRPQPGPGLLATGDVARVILHASAVNPGRTPDEMGTWGRCEDSWL